jgi:hypothetical protein
VKRDADLQNALIQMPQRSALGAPEQLERLVLLEVFASIELRNALEELQRRRFAAPMIHSGMLS